MAARLADPVTWGEHYLRNRDGSPRSYWPSWLNPSWSAQREAELAEFYGGKGSAGWQHDGRGGW